MSALFRWAASSTLAHVAFAFVVMGGWAAFVNGAHPMPQPLISGVAQGAASAFLTLVLKKGLERLRIGGPAGAIAPPLITASLILALLLSVHTLAGTPEIWTTIAFPFAVSTTYAVLYNLKLWRARTSA